MLRDDAPVEEVREADMDYSHWLFKEVKWVFAAVCAVFIFVILISYSPQDSAWSFVSEHNGTINNFGGLLGAWVSDFLLYFLGVSAYLLPLLLFFQLLSFRPALPRPLWLRCISVMVLCLCVSVLGTLSSAPHLYPESTGGLLGAMMAAYLVPLMGYSGTVLFFLFLLFCAITVRASISWLRVLERIGAVVEVGAVMLYRRILRLSYPGILASGAVLGTAAGATGLAQSNSETLSFPEEGEEDEEEEESVQGSSESDLYDDFFDEVSQEEERLENEVSEDDEEDDPSLDANKNAFSREEQVNHHVDLEKELASLLERPSWLSTEERPVQQEALRLDNDRMRPIKQTRRKRRYMAPSIRLLNEAPVQEHALSPTDIEMYSRLIETKLREFGVTVRVVSALPGPVITRYEIEPDVGVKGAQIVNLVKDLARSLSVLSIRVVETIPGKSCMGLEVPNQHRHVVTLSEVIRSSAYRSSTAPLTMILGKDIAGQPVVADLARMPHLLVAGTTGSGKSVGINAMILSLVYRSTPDQLRMLLIDPKILELSVYEEMPHLLSPVVTDMKKATRALSWCVSEMERRYQMMSSASVRHITGFNEKVREHQGDAAYAAKVLGYEAELTCLPHIVVVIDEFADLMMVVGKKIEELIARLAQKARAAGIHLILATQRPSVDVITGLIKANIPTRIAFQVSSKIDSRTIIDQMGAESLLGQGDMLYLPPGIGYPLRVHGAYVSDEEVQRVTAFLREHNQVSYALDWDHELATDSGDRPSEEEEDDPLYGDAVQIVLQSKRPSISLVQRHLRVGYNRAARLLERMEKEGIVSSMNTTGARDILVSKD